MSKTIHVLDNETIDHIAAGEVVERPLSIVKELVENSIDAGSTAITVEIKGGGIDFIRVTDNGEGIPSNQIDTAFMRHATSKITNKNDLLSISSLGFRGEALSSVCAVSRVELITKTRDEISGSRYVIHGGKKIEQKEVGAPDGSTFVIRDLFYNTPARREFLKSPGTEGRAIEECMTHFTLSHPDIRWQFIGEGKTKLSTSGNADLKTSVYYSFGTEVSKTLIPVSGETEGAKLSGFIAKPDFSRGNRTYMNYFVNGRFIKSKIISAAILDGYRDFLMSHRFPFTALTLDIEPDKIDVNVHPTKLEVRFSDERKIYELIYVTIKNTLNNITLIPEETLYDNSSSLSERGTQVNALKQERNTALNQTKINDEITNVYKNTTAESHETKSVTKIESIQPFEQNRLKITPTPVRQFEDTESEEIKENRNQFVEENILKTSDEVEFRIIGQVFETYWMIEYKNELLIIDQHAAHEKVLYEKFVEKMKNKQGLCQEL
ncbi:MAG: DNA mismatch repair endonuclease MutL, partial [Eubacterium sp.]|nr:DNA mismatch repair endonuclease MutL [Eubacterium sp.]